MQDSPSNVENKEILTIEAVKSITDETRFYPQEEKDSNIKFSKDLNKSLIKEKSVSSNGKRSEGIKSHINSPAAICFIHENNISSFLKESIHCKVNGDNEDMNSESLAQGLSSNNSNIRSLLLEENAIEVLKENNGSFVKQNNSDLNTTGDKHDNNSEEATEGNLSKDRLINILQLNISDIKTNIDNKVHNILNIVNEIPYDACNRLLVHEEGMFKSKSKKSVESVKSFNSVSSQSKQENTLYNDKSVHEKMENFKINNEKREHTHQTKKHNLTLQLSTPRNSCVPRQPISDRNGK